MEALRKLSSMGRSKESKEAARVAVQREQQASKEQPEDELLNGGDSMAENNETATESLVGPSPPRARVTEDVEDEVEEVAGDDDGYDSAVEKMGTSSSPSVVEEPQAPKAAEVPMSFAQALQKGDEQDEIETEEKGNDDSPKKSSSSSSSDEEVSSSRSSSSSAEAEAKDDAISRQLSIRAMPVARVTTENEDQEEEVDVDDGNRDTIHESLFLYL